MTKRIFQGVFWIAIYLLITLAPLFILLAGPRPAGREFWRDLSVGLGYSGFAMMGLQFVLTARFKRLKAPYGSDIVYFFHRQISLVSFGLIAAHPLLLFIFDPQHLNLLNLVTAPWAARFGVVAILSLGALIGLSVWRKRLRIEYDRWRIWHGILATGAMALAMAHIELRGYYLNTLWKQLFWGIYGIFWVGVLAWVRVIKPILLLRKAYRVEKVTPERGNAWTVTLRPENHSGLRFQPGQFAWITAWDSPFRDREHPFSFSGSAVDSACLSFTIKELGDFTASIKTLPQGQRVYVDGPYGAFSIDRHPHAQEFIFIAGGIGITPIMSMLRSMADRGDSRPLTLIYANKTLEAATFLEEIEGLPQKLNLKVIHVLESPPEGWTGQRGYVNADILKQVLPAERAPNRVETFICGPSPMMDAVEKSLTQLGVPLGDFHSERFDLV
ncbi:MAG TPA: ferric reductase-like transmembrane domain-containing protein [Anaerolinea sp.]|nr:ferric reductase-like transmembrane domain-containing protein [Anaerolinea sp.]